MLQSPRCAERREYDVADELQEEGAALRFYVDELADASEQLTALSTDRHQACFGDLVPPMTSHYLSELVRGDELLIHHATFCCCCPLLSAAFCCDNLRA